jgi:hypothetical protein
VVAPVHRSITSSAEYCAKRLGEHRGALLPGRDELVGPPLVRDLVRGDVGGDVDLLGIGELLDEADVLRVRDRVRERLREGGVRKLEDARLLELYGENFSLNRASDAFIAVSMRSTLNSWPRS